MENNKKIMRELYELYLELGHEVFEEKIKKPMELHYLHNTHVSSNVTSMSSLILMICKTISLGMLRFMKMIFLAPQILMRKFILMILCLLSMMIIVMTLML